MKFGRIDPDYSYVFLFYNENWARHVRVNMIDFCRDVTVKRVMQAMGTCTQNLGLSTTIHS